MAFAAIPVSGIPSDDSCPADFDVVSTAAVPIGGEEEAGIGTDNCGADADAITLVVHGL